MQAGYTPANLDTHNVLAAPNLTWVVVHKDHPAVALLHHNAEMLGNDIHLQQSMDTEWYKISKDVLTAACQTLRSALGPYPCAPALDP